MKVALEGKTEITDEFARHFDTCLGCMACVTACPSGVQYDKLVEATRPQIERHIDRSKSDRLFRRLIFSLFPYPTRLRWIAVKLWGYQRLGVRWFVRNSGLLSLLPRKLQAMAAGCESLKHDFCLLASLPLSNIWRGTNISGESCLW